MCFYFMQIVLQETRPKGPGRGQSKSSNRGRLQKTRAHKVRTRVCLQISCNTGWMSTFPPQSLLLTFYFTCSISVLQRERSLSFLYCLPFCCSQEIPNLSLAGLCFLKTGKKGTESIHWDTVNYLSLLMISSSCCRVGTSLMQSPVWSLCPYCSSSPRRNLLWAGGSTLKVSELLNNTPINV